MPLPNFLIIGAAKSGTTALYAYLKDHPQVFMSPVKEPRYFAFAGESLDPLNPVHRSTVTDLEEYKNLFAGAEDAIALGEASPSYLHNPNAPPHIRAMVPEAKLIAILRNPADRAFSHFMHFVKLGRETTLDFREALDNPDGVSSGSWFPRRNYLSFGYYGLQLKRYFSLFDRSQMKIFIYEEFRKDPLSALEEIYEFLGIQTNFRPDTQRQINVSGIPRSRHLQRWLRRPSRVRSALGHLLPERSKRRLLLKLRAANLERISPPDDVRATLLEKYQPDIALLESLLERKIDCWNPRSQS